MDDPTPPEKPVGYVDLEAEPTPHRLPDDTRGCSDDDMSEASLEMFPV